MSKYFNKKDFYMLDIKSVIEEERKKRKKKRTLSFQLDEELLKKFDDYVKREQIKKVAVIEILLRKLLES